ncbi:Zinc finger BED domain-containing [Labeo rohita]|uniref:Zinc finger BED domain-containing n=1 Tax=Labeo rohita TaxID=84645 RepID=A0A498MCR1_LABRO|nr:Zinc finger BED domain-containing [Labeo rohita]
MLDTRFSTVFLISDSIKDVYAELREKFDNHGESRRIDEVSPDVLEFLLEFLCPFYQAQRELEGDQYPTINLVVLWHKQLKRHCRPVASDSPHQAIIREQHLEWLNRKIKIETLHKLAIFLWPKFPQLRMLSHG